MRQASALVFVLLCAFVPAVFAGTAITATTTLTLETANNTSAADSFTPSINGNIGAGNISKESLRKLLYSGAKTKIYAHYMAWWGNPGHINVGYDSSDAAQVHRQITDMMSRGIDGMIIDWYGPSNTRTNQSSFNVKQDSETRGGKFEFAIMEDQGAIRICAYTSGCDVTQALISDFNYIVNTFAVSPAYMRSDGRPVIFTFDVESLPNIDWRRVMAGVQGNPKIIFHNAGGFKKTYTSGSFSWMTVNSQNQGDWGQGYLDNFYVTSQSYPTLNTYPSAYKGFDDRAASWSQNRIMSQNCGQVWLATMNEIGQYFSATNEPKGIQLVTWNDYEEGTALETGVENCVGVSGSVNGSNLGWVVSGQENTIDHYTVFISQDGQKLMPLTDVPVGVYQMPLAGYGFAPGDYTLYVKAVGKSSMTNKISGPIPFTVIPPFAVQPISPANGATITGRIRFAATTTGPAATAYRIYVDNVSLYAVNSATLDTNLSLKPGTHNVTVQAWDAVGEVAKSSLTITVLNQPPTVDFSLVTSSTVVPLTVKATATGSDADGTISLTSIDFGDGTVVKSSSAVHTYLSAGTYTITAKVTDDNGAQAIAKRTVTGINPGVVLQRPARNQSVTNPVAVSATATLSVPIASMRVYVDNKPAYTSTAYNDATATLDTKIYASRGVHYLVVVAWDESGKSYQDDATIIVK
jgi:hypothetical protein